ncbi:MAG: hypothetical protein JXA33_05795 [Anaerolineae bacterium]|nr:hypothetical protein [Anaerolineae bacterium]
MTVTGIAFVLIISGVIITVQGIQIQRGRYRPRANLLEQVLLSALALKKRMQEVHIIGRLRVVYGLFFVTLGIWVLL